MKLLPSNLVWHRGKTLGFVLLGGLYIFIPLISGAIFVFLLGLGSEWFYAKDWWILGAIFRLGEWLVSISVGLYCLFFFVMWLVLVTRVILGLEKELEI